MTELSCMTGGVCQRAEALSELGRYPAELALRTGRLRELFPGVLAMPGSPARPPPTAAAAIAWCGGDAVLCGDSAAWLWGAASARDTDVHLLRERGRNRRAPPGIVVHQGAPRRGEVTRLGGLPVLARPAVVAELLCRRDRRHGFVVADELLRVVAPRRRARVRARVLAALERRAAGAAARARYALLTGRARSPAGSALLLAVAEAGFPAPRQWFPIHDDRGRELYRLELAWPAVRVALESRADHAVSDPLRDGDLAARGWLLVHGDARTEPERRLLYCSLAAVFGAASHDRKEDQGVMPRQGRVRSDST